MWRASLRNLLAHKGRLVLSVLTVMLSTGFVAGTFVFTDTLGKTFDDLFAQTTSDILVSPVDDSPAAQGQLSSTSTVATLDPAVLAQVEDTPGVVAAIGDVFVQGLALVGSDGELVSSAQGAPTFGTNWTDDARLTPLRLVQGVGPTAEGEIAIDTEVADAGNLAVGSKTSVVTAQGTVPAEVVGIFRFGTTGNLAGATILAFDTATAQQLLLDGADRYTSVSAAVADTTTPEAVKATLTGELGDGVQVQTGEEAADATSADIQEGLRFVTVFLLVFAFVAIVVGLYLIFNTFAMLVAQRSRELALLRALGARRTQVRAGILLEAVVVGLVGALAGVAVGIGLAYGLRVAFDAAGASLPAGGLVIEPRTVLVALAVGLVATVLAALIPALRASRVSPLAAMRDDMLPASRSLHVRSAVGAALLVLAGALAWLGLVEDDTSTAASLVGAGFLTALVGLTVMAPALCGPLVRVVGAPFRGTVGRLAVANTLRNRRRTALTASALTLGLAIVAAFSTIAASTTASTDQALDDAVKADFIVLPKNFVPMAAEVRQALAAVDGVATVSPARQVPARFAGTDALVTGVDAATFSDAISLPDAEGSLDTLRAGELAVDRQQATDNNLTVGSEVDLELPTGTETFRVGAVYEPEGFFSGFVLSNQALADAGLPEVDALIYVVADRDSDPATVRAAIDDAMSAFPTVLVQDLTEFKSQIRGQINQLLSIIYVLLALSLIVALLGIVNTLALSVVERTREIGLLRAVGTSRLQLRRMIRVEALITSVFGAVVGLVLGVVFGQLLVRVLEEQGLSVVATPWASLLAFLLVAAVLGVLAAAWPAWRASRLDILAAIATE